MKKGLLVMAMVVAGVGTLAADPVQPQLLLDMDGAVGVRTMPTADAGHALGGAALGLEYIPSFVSDLGFNVDYNYLAVGKPSDNRDNDIDLSLRWFAPSWGTVTGWVQGGIGLNTTPNVVNGHYAAFIEPGVRWMLLPRLAFDGGVQYLVSSPDKAFVQSIGVTLGLSVPLDADFAMSDSADSAKPAAAAPKAGM